MVLFDLEPLPPCLPDRLHSVASFADDSCARLHTKADCHLVVTALKLLVVMVVVVVVVA